MRSRFETRVAASSARTGSEPEMATQSRVLVVEDNSLNLKLVRDVLLHAGFDVIEARSGEDGIARALTYQPDIILMDLQLPGIDGTQAMQTIKGSPVGSNIPIVALTAFAMSEDRERALRDGFDGYLIKPISVRDLPGQVTEFLPKRPAND
jgi:two-component system, cell cycle response regulator DivK